MMRKLLGMLFILLAFTAVVGGALRRDRRT